MHSEMLLHSVKADLHEKQEQIHQLKRVLHEIRQIKHEFSEAQHLIPGPHLNREAWRGTHAERFEDIREGMNKAYRQIKSEQVSGIIESIEGKIHSLDVHALHEGIQHTIEKLDKQKQQLEKLEKSVEHMAGMKDALKGKGGDAIRTFYEECHKPFLLFFGMFIDEYKKVLKQTQHAISSVESDSHGMIAEAFLSHDARHGIKHAREVTEQLTDAVNRQTSAINHIVSLPTVNDTFFRLETEQAERLITDTLHKLFQFDGQQTQALETAKLVTF